ncbi:hypothetical protein RRG08_027192 [Elysia crispata]|uniref:Uncharacterized protein n=1 Tax=Elysia crispata TaxID=231223 RepID=A0AAE1A661_9GAST|nr:hypothetical protein RRG08_027192 [Elysia crispata]
MSSRFLIADLSVRGNGKLETFRATTSKVTCRPRALLVLTSDKAILAWRGLAAPAARDESGSAVSRKLLHNDGYLKHRDRCSSVGEMDNYAGLDSTAVSNREL